MPLPFDDVSWLLFIILNLVCDFELTHLFLWNVGVDYLSAAAYDDLLPSHLEFLEGRVWKFSLFVLGSLYSFSLPLKFVIHAWMCVIFFCITPHISFRVGFLLLIICHFSSWPWRYQIYSSSSNATLTRLYQDYFQIMYCVDTRLVDILV